MEHPLLFDNDFWISWIDFELDDYQGGFLPILDRAAFYIRFPFLCEHPISSVALPIRSGLKGNGYQTQMNYKTIFCNKVVFFFENHANYKFENSYKTRSQSRSYPFP